MLQILVGLVAVGGHDGAADAASKCLQLKAARSQRPSARQSAIFGGGAEFNILGKITILLKPRWSLVWQKQSWSRTSPSPLCGWSTCTSTSFSMVSTSPEPTTSTWSRCILNRFLSSCCLICSRQGCFRPPHHQKCPAGCLGQVCQGETLLTPS